MIDPDERRARQDGSFAAEIWLLTILALLPVVPWAFITLLETDGGWEDAIWRYPSWSKTMAWVTAAVGVAAASAAFAFGWRLRQGYASRDRLWMRVSLTVEAVAIVGWIVLACTAPG